jgi:hypothetical protein
MPYIAPDARKKYEQVLGDLCNVIRRAPPGEVTYCIAVITNAWLASIKPVGYTEMAMLVGILETAKAELIERCLRPYEDGKLSSNGDVGYKLFKQEEEMK